MNYNCRNPCLLTVMVHNTVRYLQNLFPKPCSHQLAQASNTHKRGLMQALWIPPLCLPLQIRVLVIWELTESCPILLQLRLNLPQLGNCTFVSLSTSPCVLDAARWQGFEDTCWKMLTAVATADCSCLNCLFYPLFPHLFHIYRSEIPTEST